MWKNGEGLQGTYVDIFVIATEISANGFGTTNLYNG